MLKGVDEVINFFGITNIILPLFGGEEGNFDDGFHEEMSFVDDEESVFEVAKI